MNNIIFENYNIWGTNNPDGQQTTIANFELAELDEVMRDFGSTLPGVFSEVGIHTLKS